MEPSTARSVESSMFIDDDDPTTTLGGLANANQEPQLVNMSPIAPLAMKPVLSIDEVVAGQAVSFGLLPPFLPLDARFASGDLSQPSWLDLAALRDEGTGCGTQVVEDPTRALTTKVVVEEKKIPFNARSSSSPAMMQERWHTAKAQPSSPSSSPYILKEGINTAMTGYTEESEQVGQLEEGEVSTDSELQLTIVPQENIIDLDQQVPTPVHFRRVAERLLNDSQFIEQVACRVIATQGVPQRQLDHVAGGGARSVLVINYTQSLIRYCEVARLPPPSFAMESRGTSTDKRHRATVTIGRAKLVFTRPIATGHFGHKREVREGAAQDAWEYLVSSNAILGTGYFVDQQQHPMSTARVDHGSLLVDHYGQSQNSLPGANRVVVGGDRNSDSQNSPRSPRCVTTTGGLRAATRPHAPTNSSNLVRSDSARSGEVRGPKSPSIHPARLQMLQHATPIDDQTMQSCSLAGLGPLNSGANVAPLGRKRPGFEKSSCLAGPHPELAMTDPRLKFNGPPARSLPAPPAFQAKQPYLPQQKRVGDHFDGNTLAKRQLTEIGRALGPHSINKTAQKSMTKLVNSLSGTAAPLARVEAICKYVSIQSPQYFEIARDGERVQWCARMAANYLNTQVVTLGPTALTWNEVLGKTTCARQFVEPYLMAGIKLYGFGGGQDIQIERVGEPVAKRQKMTIGGMGARNYATVHDEVEELVQGVKKEVIKTDPVY